MTACPYGIPKYDWDKSIPYVRKCTMCYSRIQEGGIPACVEACPYEATQFGPRSELITEAKKRIADSPNRYINKVFGETEIGGTCILYISDVPLDFLAFKPELGEEPLPQLTWAALSKVPPLIAGVGGIMTGVWWVINRRMQLQEQNLKDSIDRQEESK
jgi:formate dehydrogenase iron-sulfur subunit